MSEFVLREDYWEDPEARQAFKRFLIEIHGLDLSDWESAGFWDQHSYRPFSFFDHDGRVVSSVQVYSLEMIVRGSMLRAAQFSGVGTLPTHRRRGLNRELTETALDRVRSDHDFVFLFSDDGAVPFYARCGFEPVVESAPQVRVSGRKPKPGLRLLDARDPVGLARIHTLASARTTVSETLGVLSESLFMFHALYTLSGLLFEIPDLEVIVALRREGPRLTVYDVVGTRIPTFAELYPYLATPDTTEVAFCFMPDRLEIEDVRWSALPENRLHDHGDFPLRAERFLFPFTAHA